MLFRRLAIALILTMVVALVGFACAEGATATPEAMRERQDSTSYTSGSDSYEVRATSTAVPAMAMPEPTAMAESANSGQDSSSSYSIKATTVPAPLNTLTSDSDGSSTTWSWAQSNESVTLSATTAVPAATTFQDYRRSPLVATSRDRTSTFSLDTDRTSFQLALNWAREGYQVDPDSVRAEEWVNAFNYQYARPRDNNSFAISSALVEHPLQSKMHLARITFQAPDVRDDNRPLNVTLVLDASGSMSSGNRVEIARAAADSIRNSLGSNDRISVVQFSDDVIGRYTVESRRPDDRAVTNSISNLRPNNSTNVQAGLNLGVRIADRMRYDRPDSYNYVILMSDGVANVDATEPFAILRTADDRQSNNPLRLITIGVGIENYNDYLLEQLAQYGNGWYRYLDDASQARATFSRENWTTISTPFADQTRAQVEWDPASVDSWRLVGYENRIAPDQAFEENRKEFAEIPSGTATTVFYEVQLTHRAGAPRGQPIRLGDVHVRWVTPINGETRQQDAEIRGYNDIRFDQPGDDLLRFGSIVALASDSYGSLPYVESEGASLIGSDLRALKSRLESFRSGLSHLDSYNDFDYVLAYLVNTLPSYEGGSGGSGYSP